MSQHHCQHGLVYDEECGDCDRLFTFDTLADVCGRASGYGDLIARIDVVLRP